MLFDVCWLMMCVYRLRFVVSCVVFYFVVGYLLGILAFGSVLLSFNQMLIGDCFVLVSVSSVGDDCGVLFLRCVLLLVV